MPAAAARGRRTAGASSPHAEQRLGRPRKSAATQRSLEHRILITATLCLLAYGADFEAQYRTVATYVDKILRGDNPGDLPIDQATKLLLVVNLKTARELGLEVPPALLSQADEVIE